MTKQYNCLSGYSLEDLIPEEKDLMGNKCWFFSEIGPSFITWTYDSVESLKIQRLNDTDRYTHWLPYWAIPVPDVRWDALEHAEEFMNTYSKDFQTLAEIERQELKEQNNV